MASLSNVLMNGINDGSDRQTIELFVGQAAPGAYIDIDNLLDGSEGVCRDDLNAEAVRVLTSLVDAHNATYAGRD